MKQFKKVFFVTLMAMVMMATSICAFAATPRWSNIAFIRGGLTISNNIAKISVSASGDSSRDVNKIKAKCELQKEDGSWKTIKTWTETEDSNAIIYTKEYAVYSGYEYRLKITVYAYNGSTLLESATEYFY